MADPRPKLPPHFDEQVIASGALIPTAAETSKTLDLFASWAAAGFGAALALLVSNAEARRWVDDSALRASGRLFAVVFALTVVQKFLAVFVQSIATSTDASRKAMTSHKELRGGEAMGSLSLPAFAQLIETTMLWPARWIFRRIIRRTMREGDFMGSARTAMRAVQAQIICVLGVVLLLTIAVFKVAWR